VFLFSLIFFLLSLARQCSNRKSASISRRTRNNRPDFVVLDHVKDSRRVLWTSKAHSRVSARILQDRLDASRVLRDVWSDVVDSVADDDPRVFSCGVVGDLGEGKGSEGFLC